MLLLTAVAAYEKHDLLFFFGATLVKGRLDWQNCKPIKFSIVCSTCMLSFLGAQFLFAANH
jgi:hypothetical protein